MSHDGGSFIMEHARDGGIDAIATAYRWSGACQWPLDNTEALCHPAGICTINASA